MMNNLNLKLTEQIRQFFADNTTDNVWDNIAIRHLVAALHNYIEELVKEKNNYRIDLGVARQSLYDVAEQRNKALDNLKETEKIIETAKRLRLVPISTEFNNQFLIEQEKEIRKELWHLIYKYEQRRKNENTL